jgi:hypothetical protein
MRGRPRAEARQRGSFVAGTCHSAGFGLTRFRMVWNLTALARWLTGEYLDHTRLVRQAAVEVRGLLYQNTWPQRVIGAIY